MSDTSPQHYEWVDVSANNQVLGGSGAPGDFIDTLVCVVGTAATSNVSIKDGGGTARVVLPAAVGQGIGTYTINIKARSQAGAWQVSTGAGVQVFATGTFT